MWFRNIIRNTTGWICKECKINYGRLERCYYCPLCGKYGEYCEKCAKERNFKCSNGHNLV